MPVASRVAEQLEDLRVELEVQRRLGQVPSIELSREQFAELRKERRAIEQQMQAVEESRLGVLARELDGQEAARQAGAAKGQAEA